MTTVFDTSSALIEQRRFPPPRSLGAFGMALFLLAVCVAGVVAGHLIQNAAATVLGVTEIEAVPESDYNPLADSVNLN